MNHITPDPEFIGRHGFCPINIAFFRDGYPVVWERHRSLIPLFWLSRYIEATYIWVASRIFPNWEPMWCIVVSGRPEMPNIRNYALLMRAAKTAGEAGDFREEARLLSMADCVLASMTDEELVEMREMA